MGPGSSDGGAGMSSHHRHAKIVASWSRRIAGRDRSEWVEAMERELAYIKDGRDAFDWAMGGLVMSTGWRTGRETAFWTALLVLGLVLPFGRTAMIALTERVSVGDFLLWSEVVSALGVGLAAAVLSFVRPDRTLIAALALPIISGWATVATLITPLLSEPMRSAGNSPELPNWLHASELLWTMFWPALAGAALGFAVSRLGRRQSEAANATT